MFSLPEVKARIEFSVNYLSTLEQFEEIACNLLRLSTVDSEIYHRAISLINDKYEVLRSQADKKAEINRKFKEKREAKKVDRVRVEKKPDRPIEEGKRNRKRVVDGEEIYLDELLEKYNITELEFKHARDYMYRNKTTFEQALNRPKMEPKVLLTDKFPVGDEMLTVAEGAARRGVKECSMRCRMYKRKCSLEAAMKSMPQGRPKKPSKDWREGKPMARTPDIKDIK
jgi:hypothetical protein